MRYYSKLVIAATVCMLVFCFISSEVIADERINIGSSVEVKKGEIIDKAISIGGDVNVHGRVKTEAVSIGGSVIISGTVDEKVVSIGGSVIIKPSAKVTGEIICIGGIIKKDPNAEVDAKITSFSFFKLFKCMGPFSVKAAKWGIPILILFALIKLIIGVALSVLIVLIFPKLILNLRKTLDKQVLKSGIAGVLTIICVPLVMFMLLVTILGIPLIPLLIIALIAAGLLGRVGIASLVGRKLQKEVFKKSTSNISAVFYGEVLIRIVCFVPVLGAVLKFLLIILGVGVIVQTRFGTKEISKKKK